MTAVQDGVEIAVGESTLRVPAAATAHARASWNALRAQEGEDGAMAIYLRMTKNLDKRIRKAQRALEKDRSTGRSFMDDLVEDLIMRHVVRN